MRPCLLIPLAVAVAGCTWVPIAPAARQVTVLREAPAGCSKVGEIDVEVTDKLVVYQRNPLRVAEELETLARNQAAGIPATHIHPLAAPAEGRQRFVAWRCKA